jgi:hypothetical protein
VNEQEHAHHLIADVVDLRDGHVLTGWVLLYETAGPDGTGSAGHLYGPEGMIDWRALGLIEWARRFTVARKDDEDE